MRISRIFTTAELRAETVIELNGGIAKYVRDVLRLTVGHSIIVFNGDGNDYPGELIDVQKKTVRVQLQQAQTSDTESALQLHLLQPLCAGDKFDLCLQKATELGVTQITPFISSRVNVNLPANRLEKKMVASSQKRIAVRPLLLCSPRSSRLCSMRSTRQDELKA